MVSKNKKLIIFGNRDFASLAHFYFKRQGLYEVVAFTVDGKYIEESSFEGLPIVPFEGLLEKFAPAQYDLFVPMSHTRMGKDREEKYLAAKRMGYRLPSYVSDRATVFENVKIGDNCFILEDNTLQPFVSIGNNVILWSGNHIGHHSVIEDHVFLTSHIVVSGHVKLERYSYLGVNATLRDGITIGEGTMVGMGGVITQSTEPYSVYKPHVAVKAPYRSDEEKKKS